MNRLLEYRYMFRRNLFPLIGFSLCFYFCYHMIAGERSIMRLMYLENRIERLSEEYQQLSSSRTDLESRVVMMRPGSIDRDLLEERVRNVLGFVHEGERILFDSGH